MSSAGGWDRVRVAMVRLRPGEADRALRLGGLGRGSANEQLQTATHGAGSAPGTLAQPSS